MFAVENNGGSGWRKIMIKRKRFGLFIIEKPAENLLSPMTNLLKKPCVLAGLTAKKKVWTRKDMPGALLPENLNPTGHPQIAPAPSV